MANKVDKSWFLCPRVFHLISLHQQMFILVTSLLTTSARLNYKGSDYTMIKQRMNSLKMELSKNPLSVWLNKDRFPTLRHLLRDEDDLNSSIFNRENTRLGRILVKAFRGENIKVLIIGGSNTAGGGLQEDERSINDTFFNILIDWWTKTITSVTGSKLKVKVIAIGGTASTFFQFCYKVYLEPYDEYELVILELSINDAKAITSPNVNKTLPLEQLTRQLINHKSQPALFYVNLFCIVSGRCCFNLMDFGQSLLGDHYNITSFNLRNRICKLEKDGSYSNTTLAAKTQSRDNRHVNMLGQAQVALMLIRTISNVFLKVMRENGSLQEHHNASFSIHNLPPPVYIKAQRNLIVKPLCWTTLTPNYKKQIIHNSLRVIVVQNKGFVYEKNIQIGGIHYSGHVYRTDAYSGWTGRKKYSKIKFAFTILPNQEDELNSKCSVGFITRLSSKGGVVDAWIDDYYKERVTISLNEIFRQTLVSIIVVQVSLGKHTLNVRIIKDGDVPITGIVVGPPDGPY